MEFVIVLLFGLILMWIFVVLPQRRRAAQHTQMLEAMEPGDEVVTAGGLYGVVQAVRDDEVDLEIAEGVRVRVARRAIAAVYEEDEDEPAADEPPADEADQPLEAERR